MELQSRQAWSLSVLVIHTYAHQVFFPQNVDRLVFVSEQPCEFEWQPVSEDASQFIDWESD